MSLVLLLLLVLGIVCFIASFIEKRKVSKRIDVLLDENNKHIRYFQFDAKQVKIYILSGIESYPVKDVDKIFWENFYEYYRTKELYKIRQKQNLQYSQSYYNIYFANENHFANFKALNVKDIESIIYEADKFKNHEDS